MNLGEKIKTLRQERGYTVNKLANMAGISQSYLRDIELGNKQPTVEYLSYICDALKISLEEFFSENSTDELYSLIKKLNSQQKNALIEFLKSCF